MFAHSVYFWLKEGLGEEGLNHFREGLNSLAAIDTVKQSYIGVPALTDRAVIDRTYSYALILIFDDQKGHDVYQEHEAHDKFRNECSVYWSKVLIYDCVASRERSS